MDVLRRAHGGGAPVQGRSEAKEPRSGLDSADGRPTPREPPHLPTITEHRGKSASPSCEIIREIGDQIICETTACASPLAVRCRSCRAPRAGSCPPCRGSRLGRECGVVRALFPDQTYTRATGPNEVSGLRRARRRVRASASRLASRGAAGRGPPRDRAPAPRGCRRGVRGVTVSLLARYGLRPARGLACAPRGRVRVLPECPPRCATVDRVRGALPGTWCGTRAGERTRCADDSPTA